MKSVEISEYDFGTREVIHSFGYESNRYLKDDKVYKFIHPNFRINRDMILRLLAEDKIDGTPKLFELLTKDGEFVGYSMEYLELYSLDAYLSVCPYDYEMRKLSCKKLIEAVNELIKNGYQHYDLHSKNVMISDGQAKIIDVDSMCNPSKGIILKDSSYKEVTTFYDCNIEEIMQKNILLIIFSVLFNRDNEIFEQSTRNILLNEFRNDEVMTSFIVRKMTKLISHGYSLEDILDTLTEEKIMKYKELKR